MADNRSRGREHRWFRRHHLRRRRGPGGPLCLDIGRNTYGGFDLYAGEAPCPPGSPSYPPCNRARVVSFDRPFASGAGASDFLTNEYPLVAWAEEHGLDVTYASDVTVDAHPGFVL